MNPHDPIVYGAIRVHHNLIATGTLIDIGKIADALRRVGVSELDHVQIIRHADGTLRITGEPDSTIDCTGVVLV